MSLTTAGLGRPGGLLVTGGMGVGTAVLASSLGFMSGADWAAAAARGAGAALVSMLPGTATLIPFTYDSPAAYDSAGTYDREGVTPMAGTIAAVAAATASAAGTSHATTMNGSSGGAAGMAGSAQTQLAVTYDAPTRFDADLDYDAGGVTAAAADLTGSQSQPATVVSRHAPQGGLTCSITAQTTMMGVAA